MVENSGLNGHASLNPYTLRPNIKVNFFTVTRSIICPNHPWIDWHQSASEYCQEYFKDENKSYCSINENL